MTKVESDGLKKKKKKGKRIKWGKVFVITIDDPGEIL